MKHPLPLAVFIVLFFMQSKFGPVWILTTQFVILGYCDENLDNLISLFHDKAPRHFLGSGIVDDSFDTDNELTQATYNLLDHIHKLNRSTFERYNASSLLCLVPIKLLCNYSTQANRWAKFRPSAVDVGCFEKRLNKTNSDFKPNFEKFHKMLLGKYNAWYSPIKHFAINSLKYIQNRVTMDHHNFFMIVVAVIIVCIKYFFNNTPTNQSILLPQIEQHQFEKTWNKSFHKEIEDFQSNRLINHPELIIQMITLIIVFLIASILALLYLKVKKEDKSKFSDERSWSTSKTSKKRLEEWKSRFSEVEKSLKSKSSKSSDLVSGVQDFKEIAKRDRELRARARNTLSRSMLPTQVSVGPSLVEPSINEIRPKPASPAKANKKLSRSLVRQLKHMSAQSSTD